MTNNTWFPHYFEIVFPHPVQVITMKLAASSDGMTPSMLAEFEVLISNNGISYETIDEYTHPNNLNTITYNLSNPKFGTYFRLQINNSWTVNHRGHKWCGLSIFELYGIENIKTIYENNNNIYGIV